jgi:hypothetical protein
VKLVAVLGYSRRRGSALHPICTARVERAAEICADGDVVVLSGRREAELMRRAWGGGDVRLVCEARARTTAENAAHVARLARDLGAREVVVVTSWWHRPRAWLLFRGALRTVRVRIVPVPGRWSGRLLLRELACLPLVPVQLTLATRRAASLLDQERGREDGEAPGDEVLLLADVDSDPREDEDDDGGEHDDRPGRPGEIRACHDADSSTGAPGFLRVLLSGASGRRRGGEGA